MAMESRADWDKRQAELRKQKDLTIEKNADALAGPGVDRNALAAEMHNERRLDPGRRQNVALEGKFADRLGIVAEHDKSPQAEAIRKVFANPEVIRSFLIEPDETAKLIARTYPEYKANLENAKPFSMVNGKPVINENSFIYQALKEANVDHKNVMKNPLAKDVDKLLKGVHGREEDIFKAIGAHIELKRKQGDLDAGHFSAKEKKGLQRDIDSLERRVEHELREVKNNTTSKIADKDFKFTRAILEKEPVTADSIAAKNRPAVQTTEPSISPPLLQEEPVVQKSPLEVHQERIVKTISGIESASTVKEVAEAVKGLTAGLSADEAKSLQAALNNREMLLPNGSRVTLSGLIEARTSEVNIAAQKDFGDKLANATSPAELRGLVEELRSKYPPEFIGQLEKEIQASSNGKSSADLVEQKLGGIFDKRVKDFQEGLAVAKSPAELRELKAKMDSDLVPNEESVLRKSFEKKIGQSADKLIEQKVETMLTERADRIFDAVDGMGTNTNKIIDAYKGLSSGDAIILGEIYKRKHGESVEKAISGEWGLSKPYQEVFAEWAKGNMEAGNKLYDDLLRKQEEAQRVIRSMPKTTGGY
jgi:hypothetical protein